MDQSLGVLLVDRVIWSLHGGSLLSEDSQPDSKRIGSENRRSTSNGELDTLLPGTKMEQRTGDRNNRSGIYRCNACDYEIVQYKGERFPPCPRHDASAPVGWTLVRP